MKTFKQLLNEMGDVVPFKKKTAPEPPKYKFIQTNWNNLHQEHKKHFMHVGARVEHVHKIMKQEHGSSEWNHAGHMVSYHDGSYAAYDMNGKSYNAEKVPLK